MYIRISESKSKNKTYEFVYLVEAYRNKNGQSRQRIIKRYGILENLVKKDPHILEKLRAQAKQMTKDQRVELNISNRKSINESKQSVNYGYFFIERIFNEIGINEYLKNHDEKSSKRYSLNQIMKHLVYSRILSPGSKLEAFQNQHLFFDSFHNKLNDIYRSLSEMKKISNNLQKVMHQNVVSKFKRDCSLVVYDITNYYFEIEAEDELKKVGVSKERKTTPIVQMGLLIDKNKIPIGYQLFPGNMADSKTLVPMLETLKKSFNIKKVTIVADKGINSSSNLRSVVSKGDNYIVSQKVRGSTSDFIDQVLDESNYRYLGNDFKIKEWIRNKKAKKSDGETREWKEKVVVFWSKNYDLREKHKRKKLNKKLDEFIKNPAKLKASNKYGIKRYIKTRHFDPKTGEHKKVTTEYEFDKSKYDRDVALDGYYAIVTSDIKKPMSDIIANYRELHKIEESFKVIKSDLEGRPVYVRRNDRIEGHFLTCFIALTILRIIQKMLGNQFLISKIRKALYEAKAKPYNQGIYILEPQDDIIKQLEHKFKAYLHYETIKHEEFKGFQKKIFTTKIRN